MEQRVGRNGAADREGRSSGSGGTGRQIGRNGATDREGRGGRSGGMEWRIGRNGAILPKQSDSFSLDLAAIYCSLIGDKSVVIGG